MKLGEPPLSAEDVNLSYIAVLSRLREEILAELLLAKFSISQRIWDCYRIGMQSNNGLHTHPYCVPYRIEWQEENLAILVEGNDEATHAREDET